METPVFFHLTNASKIRFAADQCQEVGFNMIILSFGSGFDFEETASNPVKLRRFKEDVAYAKSKGVEVAAYDLIALTRQPPFKNWTAVNNDSYTSACLASGWYDYLYEKIEILIGAGLSGIEADGTYSGYTCSSTDHKYHNNELDSVYRMSQKQGQLFTKLLGEGIYINQPELYFFKGGNKGGMGYDESQFSLPRWEDLSISRQGFYDDTFNYLSSQGWMFLPIDQYHGGGDAAIFEPLEENLKAYDWALAQYFGAGIQACYRGRRLYDTAKTKAVVRKWTDFFYKYHGIFGDIIHIKRADMQGLDAYMSIPDPLLYSGDYKGLVMIFNPAQATLEDEHFIDIPLYYTGLTDKVTVITEDQEEAAKTYVLTRNYMITVKVDLKPETYTWLLLK